MKDDLSLPSGSNRDQARQSKDTEILVKCKERKKTE